MIDEPDLLPCPFCKASSSDGYDICCQPDECYLEQELNCFSKEEFIEKWIRRADKMKYDLPE